MGLFKKSDLKVAADIQTFDFILNELGYRKDPKLRAAVASNANIQHQLLDRLAKDSEVEVRVAAARNPRKMTPKSWDVLNADESEEVRAALKEVWPERIQEILHGSGHVPDGVKRTRR